MRRLAILALLALSWSPAFGQGSGTLQPVEPSWPPYWPDLHNQNRAIAFGSVLMAGNGGHLDDWKEVRAYGYCNGSVTPASPGTTVPSEDQTGSGTSTASVPGSGLPPDASGGGVETACACASATTAANGSTDTTPAGTVTDCDTGWSVMFTTGYQLVECPDGRAYIARSGEGVYLTDRHTGAIVDWAEAIGCDAGGGVLKLTGKAALDKDRPLDVAHLKITRR